MTKGTRNRVIRIIRDQLLRMCCEFIETKRYSSNEGAIFQWTVSDELTLFVCVIIIDTYEAFTVELAASPSRDFPFHQLPGDKPAGGDYLVRLAELAGIPSIDGMEHLWRIARPSSLGTMIRHIERGMPLNECDVSDERITNVVSDAIKVFAEYGIPFFDKIAKEKGLEINWGSGPGGGKDCPS